MKKIFLIVILGILVVGGYFFYKREMEPHPYISACSDYVKSMMKSPSSYKMTKATMLAPRDGSTPFIIIDYESQNSFGAMVAEKAVFDFCLPEKKYEIYQTLWINESPFDTMEICKGKVENISIDYIGISSIRANANLKKLNYKGTPAPGKITSVNEDIVPTFEGGMIIYTPGKIFPYD